MSAARTSSHLSPREEERDLIKDLRGTAGGEEEEEEEEEFFNHYKNDLKRHAHTPSGVAGADLKS